MEALEEDLKDRYMEWIHESTIVEVGMAVGRYIATIKQFAADHPDAVDSDHDNHVSEMFELQHKIVHTPDNLSEDDDQLLMQVFEALED